VYGDVGVGRRSQFGVLDLEKTEQERRQRMREEMGPCLRGEEAELDADSQAKE
jgi:hypothetical protein